LRRDPGGNGTSLDARHDHGIEVLLGTRAPKAAAGPQIRDKRVERERKDVPGCRDETETQRQCYCVLADGASYVFSVGTNTPSSGRIVSVVRRQETTCCPPPSLQPCCHAKQRPGARPCSRLSTATSGDLLWHLDPISGSR
jgi:hypothetical protein